MCVENYQWEKKKKKKKKNAYQRASANVLLKIEATFSAEVELSSPLKRWEAKSSKSWIQVPSSSDYKEKSEIEYYP